MTTASRKTTRQLLGDLFGGLRNLAHDHVDEIKAERAEEREARRRAPVQFGAAIGITLVGALLVGQALAFGLAAVGLPLWLGYGIIGVVVFVVGIVLLKRMRSTSQIDSVPETAIKRIGHDLKEIAEEVVHDVKTVGDAPQLPSRR